jgi:hypothetical protein
MHLIIKLADRCESLPPSLYVQNVKRFEKIRPKLGGYSDIYQGLVDIDGSKQHVAIKKPRMIEEQPTAHKVLMTDTAIVLALILVSSFSECVARLWSGGS